MDNEWDEYADSWDSDPAARAYAAAAFGSLVEILDSSKRSLDGASVLDFGCGTGLLTEHMVAAGATVYAVDTSTAMLDTLAAKIDEHGWTTVRTSTQLPGASERFSLVVCSSVCAFLDDYPAVAGELVARLVAGGLFVQWDWEGAIGDDHGLTRDRIGTTLDTAGLADVHVDTAFTIEANGETMSPLVGHGQRSGPDVRL